MLNNVDHLDLTQRLTIKYLVDGLYIHRFIAVLQPNLQNCRITLGEFYNFPGIFNRGCHGFFQEDMFARLDRFLQHFQVGVVGCGNDQSVNFWISTGFLKGCIRAERFSWLELSKSLLGHFNRTRIGIIHSMDC